MTIPLLAFLAPLAYSPGPGNAFMAALGATGGVRAATPANIGYHIATFVVTLAIGLGFGWVTSLSPTVLKVLGIAGALYVLWLAFLLIRAGVSDTVAEPKPTGMMDGAVLMVLNPKAYLIILLMFTQFLGEGEAGHWTRIFWITAIFTANNFVAFWLWAYAGDRLTALFRDPVGARRSNIVLGLMLAAVAVWMLLR